MTGPAREEGFAAGAEALVLGVLVFVVGTLLVVSAWGVIDAKLATAAAAREATRAVVEAAPGDDLQAVAERAARRALDGHGRAGAEPRVTAVGADRLERCAEIGYRVEITVPAIAVVGDVAVGDHRVGSRHFELVDPYRSGLPVDDPGQGAACGL